MKVKRRLTIQGYVFEWLNVNASSVNIIMLGSTFVVRHEHGATWRFPGFVQVQVSIDKTGLTPEQMELLMVRGSNVLLAYSSNKGGEYKATLINVSEGAPCHNIETFVKKLTLRPQHN